MELPLSLCGFTGGASPGKSGLTAAPLRNGGRKDNSGNVREQNQDSLKQKWMFGSSAQSPVRRVFTAAF